MRRRVNKRKKEVTNKINNTKAVQEMEDRPPTLVMWARRKYKKLNAHKTRARKFVTHIAEKEP